MPKGNSDIIMITYLRRKEKGRTSEDRSVTAGVTQITLGRKRELDTE